MNIISIDPSLYSTGIYLKTNNKEKSLTIKNKKSTHFNNKLKNIYEQILNILKEFNIDFGVFEGYAFSQNKLSQIAEVKGVIRLAFSQVKKRVIEMPINTWKSFGFG